VNTGISTSDTAGRYSLLVLLVVSVLFACKAEKPVKPKKPPSVVIIKPKRAVLTGNQRKELGFLEAVISQVELAAGAEAEPFFVTEVVPSANMKGEEGFERARLAGFSVHTTQPDELITTYRVPLHAKGYLLFRSQRSYGKLNDIVTIVKGNATYDILKMQRTEAPNYHLDTSAIIAWLKERQKDAPFVVTGAGPDWLETRFIKPPRDMMDFANKAIAFAPDVLGHDQRTVDRLAEKMDQMNGFFLVWD
jgi:Domain of unknown function (DUF4253)